MASLSLSSSERLLLDEAVLEYLAQRCGEAAEAFATGTGLPTVAPGASAPAAAGVGASALERRWVSVVRLQRRVLELEAASAAARTTTTTARQRRPEEESDFGGGGGRDSSSLSSPPLPPPSLSVCARAPCAAELKGHRQRPDGSIYFRFEF